MEENKLNKRNLVFAVIGLVFFIIAFIWVFKIYLSESENRSVFVEAAPQNKTDYIEILAYIVTVDPIKGDMTVRLDFQPKGGLANDKGFLNEDIELYVNSSTGKQDYSFSKGKLMNPMDITLSFYNGLVTDYPFDSHKADLFVMTNAKPQKSKTENIAAEETEIPIENAVNFSGSVTGYKIDAALDEENGGNITSLNIEINRAGSTKFFAMFVIIVMWVLTLMLCLLLFNILVLGRKIEIAMFTFASAMIFAFPAFRNMMPLAPPIGAFPDFIAFFWAEGFAALTLVILISTWLVRKQ